VSPEALPQPTRFVTTTEAGKGMFKGYVSAAFFLGDRTRLIVHGMGRDKLTIETNSRREYKEGDETGVDIDLDMVLVI
jgi:hypothetical protein